MLSSNLRKNSKILIVILDQVLIHASFLFALLLRFDFQWSKIEPQYLDYFWQGLPFVSVLTFTVFLGFGLYRIVWRYISVRDILRVLLASLVSAAAYIVFSYVLQMFMPISVLAMAWILVAVLATALRMLPRVFLYVGFMDRKRAEAKRSGARVERCMIVGAGNAGEILLKDILLNKNYQIKLIGFVDDNENLQNRSISGVPILGRVRDLEKLCQTYRIDLIIVAIPSADSERRKEILDICNRTSCKLKIIPSFYQMVKGDVEALEFRDVTIDDLLGREPIRVNLQELGAYLLGKTVLVTGGGGSIGSELARQIAKLGPKRLVLFDVFENNLYDIQMELRRTVPDLSLTCLIGTIRDKERLREVFETYHPDVIFHAAAHKHVPLMEDSPLEAIKNNIQGTLNVAQMADCCGAERFVMISTDKAVHPTSVMGATKRVCEMMVQTLGQHSRTKFVAVRFGNVLGSSGSVIPLFKKQIEEGGPVTVTHPDIIRYFMTIPEAVSLVLQAGAYANSSEIYVLDMGKPVKILDLAKKMIRLSGHVPGEDIQIKFIGLRPGEKLYEEMLMHEEGLRKTPNDLIYVAKPIEIDEGELFSSVETLVAHAEAGSPDSVERLHHLVPFYNSVGKRQEEDKA